MSKFTQPKPANCLGDEDPMPFGKHKGTPMSFVPPGYLDWLDGQDWIAKWPKIHNYILWRRAALDEEMKRAERGASARAPRR